MKNSIPQDVIKYFDRITYSTPSKQDAEYWENIGHCFICNNTLINKKTGEKCISCAGKQK